MLKKYAFLGFCVALILLGIYFWNNAENSPQISKKNVLSHELLNTPTPSIKILKETSAVFVPYWDIPSITGNENQTQIYDPYTDLYYFGISANSNGVNKNDPGYLNLQKFTDSAANTNRYLTLRMLDVDENSIILKNKSLQEKIIKQTLETVQKYGFKGVVLDLEQGVLPFSHVVDEINSFVADFHLSAQQNKMTFLETIYGDTFYKKRPFDVQNLGKNTDGLIIMAYDFSKANGDPGPNFPFSGKQKYGYDFQQMVTDFLAVVPADKITVVFGMYGYDWTTDYKGNPIQTGKSIALNEIKANYIEKCDWQNCVTTRDSLSGENEINYVDSSSSAQLIYHTIWFEDVQSVKQKTEFLKQKGIGRIAYWALGYF